MNKKIGWSRSAVSNYIILLDQIATQNLEFAKKHQTGRVAENATSVAIDFTEGGLRELIGL